MFQWASKAKTLATEDKQNEKAWQRHSIKCQSTEQWCSRHVQRTKTTHMLITIQSYYPSLSLFSFITSHLFHSCGFFLDPLLRKIKYMKGRASLLVRCQAEIEWECYFLSAIFFTGRLCNVDGNWTESKGIKSFTRACITSAPNSRFRGKFILKV